MTKLLTILRKRRELLQSQRKCVGAWQKSNEATGLTCEAVSEYESVLKVNPNLFIVHINFGVLPAQTGEIEKAEQHFKKAIQLDPASGVAEYNLAKVFHLRGEIQKAIDHYQKAIALNPEYAEAYYNLGVIMEQQGRSKESESYFSEVKRIVQKANQN